MQNDRGAPVRGRLERDTPCHCGKSALSDLTYLGIECLVWPDSVTPATVTCRRCGAEELHVPVVVVQFRNENLTLAPLAMFELDEGPIETNPARAESPHR